MSVWDSVGLMTSLPCSPSTPPNTARDAIESVTIQCCDVTSDEEQVDKSDVEMIVVDSDSSESESCPFEFESLPPTPVKVETPVSDSDIKGATRATHHLCQHSSDGPLSTALGQDRDAEGSAGIVVLAPGGNGREGENETVDLDLDEMASENDENGDSLSDSEDGRRSDSMGSTLDLDGVPLSQSIRAVGSDGSGPPPSGPFLFRNGEGSFHLTVMTPFQDIFMSGIITCVRSHPCRR